MTQARQRVRAGMRLTIDELGVFFTQRCQAMLPPTHIQDLDILDLGSGSGAMGAWALKQGCRSWTGVEIDDAYYHASLSLLAQNFHDHQWQVIQQDALEFLINTDRKWDLVLAAGIIYGYPDSVRFIDACLDRSDWVIIESSQPYLEIDQDQIPHLLDHASFSVYRDRPLSGETKRQWGYPSQCPSSMFVAHVGRHRGFQSDSSMDRDLRQRLPEHYNATSRGRYCQSLKKS